MAQSSVIHVARWWKTNTLSSTTKKTVSSSAISVESSSVRKSGSTFTSECTQEIKYPLSKAQILGYLFQMLSVYRGPSTWQVANYPGSTCILILAVPATRSWQFLGLDPGGICNLHLKGILIMSFSDLTYTWSRCRPQLHGRSWRWPVGRGRSAPRRREAATEDQWREGED